MLTQDLKTKYTPLKDEMYQLLIGAYTYNLKAQHLPERLRTNSRLFLLEEAIALRLMANEITLHLCKLDDDSSSFSFRSAFKDINKLSLEQKAKDTLNSLLKEYRSSINELKVQHRNSYIAHRNSEDYPDLFDLPSYTESFHALFRMAHNLFKVIWGTDVKFSFKLGSQEREINFATELKLTND